MVSLLEAANLAVPFCTQDILWCVFYQLNPCVILTLCIPFPLLQSCLLSQLWISISQLAVHLLLFIVRHYLSFVEVHIFLKGMTFEKLKTQECYFCHIFKDVLQSFTMLWLEIKQFIMLSHLWYRERIRSLVSFLFSCIPSTCIRSAHMLWCA